MNLTISFTSAKKAIVTFLHRFHVMIFVVVVLVGLIYIVYLLYNIIIASTDTKGYTPDSTNTSFDKATIKRIDELKTRGQSGEELDLSQGRTNPFVE
jgi:exopolysaccharide biosynthesis protein